MKFRTITLIFLLVVTSSMVLAQITLTAERNTPPAGYLDTLVFGSPEGLSAPAEGAAQLWDYSNILEDTALTLEVLDVRGNTYLPTARSSKEGTLSFQAFRTPSSIYYAADEQGIYPVGRTVMESSFPLTSVTGNPNDVFEFIADTVAYEGRINEIQFPMTYQDSFGDTQIERTNISLTVAAFGLDDTPVEGRRYYTEMSSVVGYGQVIIPLADRSPSLPIDVLLVRTDISAVDSFFVAGTLAPPELTAAFGVSQGIVSTDLVYQFFTPGLSEPVLRINYNDLRELSGTVYRPVAANLVSSTRTFSPVRVITSPNPVRRGDVLRIQADQELAAHSLHLLNQQGQLVSIPNTQRLGDQYAITIPGQLPPGVYFLQAYDQENRRMQSQKIIIQ